MSPIGIVVPSGMVMVPGAAVPASGVMFMPPMFMPPASALAVALSSITSSSGGTPKISCSISSFSASGPVGSKPAVCRTVTLDATGAACTVGGFWPTTK